VFSVLADFRPAQLLRVQGLATRFTFHKLFQFSARLCLIGMAIAFVLSSQPLVEVKGGQHGFHRTQLVQSIRVI